MSSECLVSTVAGSELLARSVAHTAVSIWNSHSLRDFDTLASLLIATDLQ